MNIGNFTFYSSNVYFFDIDVSGSWVLGYIKSWIQAYLHNKLGSLQGKKTTFSYTHTPEKAPSYGVRLFFDKQQKDNDVYLRACIKKDDEEWQTQLLDYQEAVWLEVLINKAIGSERW